MASRRFTLVNKYGLHARACAKLLNTAGQFESRIVVVKGEQEAPAQSLTRLLMLAAGPGTELTVHAEGQDADAALAALGALIENRFEETE